MEIKASLLASHGFAALAVAYIGYDDIPKSPTSMDMEYFEEAANWLSNHPEVLPYGIGVHAMCFGSWIDLLMASLNMKAIKTVVAISPVVVAYTVPFQYRGKVSDLVPLKNSEKITVEEGRIWRYAFPTVTTDYCPPVSKYSAFTPVENISCPVLLVCGTGDLHMNPETSQMIFDRLKTRGREHLCSILRYPGAGHLIEPPYSPLCYSTYSWTTKRFGDPYLVLGGETEAHAKAQEDAWPKILSFLRRNLQNVEPNIRTTRININRININPNDYYNPLIDYYNPVMDYYNLLLRFEPCLNLLGLILILCKININPT